MNRRVLVLPATAAAAVVAVTGWTSLVSAASPDGLDQIVLELPDGAVTVTLSPDEAPEHVAAVRELLTGEQQLDLRLDRVAAGQYVQIAVPDATTWRGMPTEVGSYGNVRGAVSLYDGPDADPTLLIVLTDSRSLDTDYTPIGWVTDGLDAAIAVSNVAVSADGIPALPVSMGTVHVPGVEGAAAPAGGSTGSAPASDHRELAIWCIALAAVAVTAVVAVFHRRLDARWTTSLLMSATLIGVFALFTSALSSPSLGPSSGLVALVVLMGAVRLMSRFEPPADRTR